MSNAEEREKKSAKEGTLGWTSISGQEHPCVFYKKGKGE